MRQPRSTHSCMTAQIRSSPERTSSSVRQVSSLASMTWLIGSPVSRQRASSSAPVVNGYRTGVASGTIRCCPVSSSSSTKPPPTE